MTIKKMTSDLWDFYAKEQRDGRLTELQMDDLMDELEEVSDDKIRELYETKIKKGEKKWDSTKQSK